MALFSKNLTESEITEISSGQHTAVLVFWQERNPKQVH